MPWTRPALDEEMAPAALVRSLRINYDLLEGSVALRDRVTTVTAVWTFSVVVADGNNAERRFSCGLNLNGRWCVPVIKVNGATDGVSRWTILETPRTK